MARPPARTRGAGTNWQAAAMPQRDRQRTPHLPHRTPRAVDVPDTAGVGRVIRASRGREATKNSPAPPSAAPCFALLQAGIRAREGELPFSIGTFPGGPFAGMPSGLSPILDSLTVAGAALASRQVLDLAAHQFPV